MRNCILETSNKRNKGYYTMKYKILGVVFISLCVMSFIWFLGLVGSMDLEEELGYALHPDSWYFIRVFISLLVFCISFIGYKLTKKGIRF